MGASLLDARMTFSGARRFGYDMVNKGFSWEELPAKAEAVFRCFDADGGMPFCAFLTWSEDENFDGKKWLEAEKEAEVALQVEQAPLAKSRAQPS